jgi:hypothetical protein
MATSVDRRRAVVGKLLSVGATRNGTRPGGVSESRLVRAIAGPSRQYDPGDVRRELRSMAAGSGPVERVGRDSYRLSSTAAGKRLRDRLADEADDDNWWERGKNGDDD